MRNNSKYSTNSDNDSGLSLGKEVLSSFSSNHSNTQSSHHGINYNLTVYLKIYITDLNKHVKYEFSQQNSVYDVKRALIKRYGQRISDPINYGLFIPHQVDKAGKFMQEERLLSEYVTTTTVIANANVSIVNKAGNILRLDFIYKSRIIWPDKTNETDLEKKVNSKVNHSRFIDYIIRNDPVKVKKALRKGLDPNFHCSSGESPLTLTAKLPKPQEVITALVSGGAHLDYRSVDSRTPLHKAAIAGNYETLTMLLNFGASANCVDNHGITPLYYSILHDHSTKCMEKLLYEHAKIGVVDRRGLREIHQACRLGKPDHLDILLAYGADIDCRTESHLSTPLHVAAYTSQEDCVRLLLLRGTDRTLTNSQGRTALDEAKLAGISHNITEIIAKFRNSEIHTKPTFKPNWNPKRRSCEFDVTSAHLKMSISVAPSQSISSSSHYLDYSTCTNITDRSKSSTSVDRGRRKTMGPKQHRQKQQEQQQGIKKSASSVRLKERSNSSHSTIGKSISYNVFSDPDDTSAASSDLRSQTNSNLEKTNRTNRFRDNCWRHSSMISLDSDSATDSDLNSIREVVLQKSTHSNYGIDLEEIKGDSRTTLFVIENVEIGSPAFLAGIRCGDSILEINGVDVRDSSIQVVKQLFRQSQQTVLLKLLQSSYCYSNASTDPSLHYEQFVYQPSLQIKPIRNAASVDNLTNLSIISSKNPQQICESNTTLNSITTILAGAAGNNNHNNSGNNQYDNPSLSSSIDNSTRDLAAHTQITSLFTMGRRNRSQSTDKKYLKNALGKNETLLKYRSPLTPGIGYASDSLKPILKNSSVSNRDYVTLQRQSPQHFNITSLSSATGKPHISKYSQIPHSNSFDVPYQPKKSITQLLKPPIPTDKEPAWRKRTSIGTPGSSKDSNNCKLSTSEEDFCLPPPVSFQ